MRRSMGRRIGDAAFARAEEGGEVRVVDVKSFPGFHYYYYMYTLSSSFSA